MIRGCPAVVGAWRFPLSGEQYPDPCTGLLSGRLSPCCCSRRARIVLEALGALQQSDGWRCAACGIRRWLGHDFRGIACFATVADEEEDFVQQLSYTTLDISR